MPPAARPRTGRPRDVDLTRRLLDGAVALVAERGYARLDADVLAARTGAGRSAVYRRWPTMAGLLAEALHDVRLVEPPAGPGSLRDDLAALVRPLGRPPCAVERTVGSVVGQAHHEPQLREALDRVLVGPLAGAVAAVGTRAAGRGAPVDPARLRLLQRLLLALWWDRCSGPGTPPTPVEAEQLVDRVLLPAVRGS